MYLLGNMALRFDCTETCHAARASIDKYRTESKLSVVSIFSKMLDSMYQPS